MDIRRYKREDIDEVLRLFYFSVHGIDSEYTDEQKNAWAPPINEMNKEEWQKTLSEHFSIVAEEDGRIIAFADLDEGYIDRLYVHPEYQRLGIARLLVRILENVAYENGERIMTTHASKKAKPFFLSQGYKLDRENEVERRGVKMKNYLMEKHL